MQKQKEKTNMNEKTIYISQGRKLIVESKRDLVTNKEYFLISDEYGCAHLAGAFVTAEGVRFTTDVMAVPLQREGLHYELYKTVLRLAQDGGGDIQRGRLGNLGCVKYILCVDLAKIFPLLNAHSIGAMCEALGFRTQRTYAGRAVIFEEEDLRAVEARFGLSTAPGEDAVIGDGKIVNADLG
jgi:hypothetical protein